MLPEETNNITVQIDEAVDKNPYLEEPYLARDHKRIGEAWLEPRSKH